MRYVITRGVMGGPHPEVPISQSDYDLGVAAKRQLHIAVAFEEKFLMLLENFREFELELVDQSLRLTITRDFGQDLVQDRLYAANRRLCNVLAGARLFVDQVLHGCSEFY